MLFVDVPTSQEFASLRAHRSDACVSFYIKTTPISRDAASGALELRGLFDSVRSQLESTGFDGSRLTALEENVQVLISDDEFWETQAHSLAVFVTPDALKTFRLPNRFPQGAHVADRFHLSPLLRTLNFTNRAFVLALSENSVRLVEVFPDLPAEEVRVPNLPKDAASAVRKSTLNDRAPNRRLQGNEGQNTRLAQYARRVDAALRPVLAGSDVPLVLAAAPRLAASYRAVNGYPSLLPEEIAGTDDHATDAELAEAVRPVLDAAYDRRIAEARKRYDTKLGASLATDQLSDAARAATFGAIELLLVNIDAEVPGTLDDESGALTLAESSGPESYDVIDEIASRALDTGARVLGVRSDDLPTVSPLAAVLRYPLQF